LKFWQKPNKAKNINPKESKMKKVIISLLAATLLTTMAIAADAETFGGLGISIQTGKSGVKIVGVMPGSPADGVGLLSGDLIVSINGTDISAVNLEEQVNLLRGKAGTSISLAVKRNGEIFFVSTKRIGISVQNLDAKEISDWYGKSKGLTAEEIYYLASKRVTEGYELLSIMQHGMPVAHSAENLSAQALQQVSVQKAEETMPEKPEAKPVQNEELNLNGKTKEVPFVNAKGARVKKQGKAPAYKLR
jgi:hypothetical protein